jgi:predicted dehydrogenase
MSIKTSRRQFIRSSALLLGGTALSNAQIIGANSTVRIAIVGTRIKGQDLIRRFAKLPHAKIVALCDVDNEVLAEAASKHEELIGKVDLETDFRRLLDRKDIDAVVLATPNHWHALQTIWSCQAGKDVYVEKPNCHTVWEGRKMIEAARKYNRIVQVGLQTSSNQALPEAAAWIKEGHIGNIQAIHAVSYKIRSSIGKRAQPMTPASSVDYDLWLGPAENKPIYRDNLHYDWHWNWNTGNGELGNVGCHVVDIARYFLDDPDPNGEIMTFGNRFAWDDAGETPNMQVASYQLGDIPVIHEINNFSASRTARRTLGFHKIKEGEVVICEGGTFVGHGHGKIYDNDGKQIKKFYGVDNHQENFIDAVISRNRRDLNCEIERGHASCTLPLLAGISYQTGAPISKSDLPQKVSSNPWLHDAYTRYQAQLDHLGISVEAQPWTCGPELHFDSHKEQFTGSRHASAANEYLKRKAYRAPYVVPDKV